MRAIRTKSVKLFKNGIGFRFWNRYGKPHGTAIRWFPFGKGLFGVMVKDGGLHVGFWWQIRFEMLAVHVGQFDVIDLKLNRDNTPEWCHWKSREDFGEE